MMDLDRYPLLSEPNIMLVALKTSAQAPAVPEDCVERLLGELRLAGERPPADLAPLRVRVAAVFRDLSIAGLLDPDEEGRCALTGRGRTVLRDHPTGVDGSVLMQFPEFRSHVRRPFPFASQDTPVIGAVEPKAAYDEGFAAFGEGCGIADNPYDFDTVAHLDWENGWSEARDQTARGAGSAKTRS